MKLTGILAKAQKVTSDNSPTILTALGVAGTLATAYLTGAASFKAAEVLREANMMAIPDGKTVDTFEGLLSNKEKVQLLWKLYIPAAGTAVITVTSIICANRIGTRRTAAMASVVAVSERAFTEYREKVIEKIGAGKEQTIRDEVAQDRVNRSEVAPNMVFVSDGNKVLCHDAFSNQYFMSDMETLRWAQNEINAQIIHSDFATVSDFYTYVDSPDLETTSVSGDLGWNTDKMLEIAFSTVMYKERTPCISIDFATVPIRDPWRFS